MVQGTVSSDTHTTLRLIVWSVYIGDSWNSNIQKFDSEGNFIAKWGTNGTGDGQFLNIGDQSGVEGIDVDSSGNVYVADSGNSRVQKFDSEGNFITKWGTNGTGDGQFIYPSGLAVGPDNMSTSPMKAEKIYKSLIPRAIL